MHTFVMDSLSLHRWLRAICVGVFVLAVATGCTSHPGPPTLPNPQLPCSYGGAEIDAVYDRTVPLVDLAAFLTPRGWTQQSVPGHSDNYIFGSYEGVGIGARFIDHTLHMFVQTAEQRGEDQYLQDLSRARERFSLLSDDLKAKFQLSPIRVEERKRTVCPQ